MAIEAVVCDRFSGRERSYHGGLILVFERLYCSLYFLLYKPVQNSDRLQCGLDFAELLGQIVRGGEFSGVHKQLTVKLVNFFRVTERSVFTGMLLRFVQGAKIDSIDCAI